MIRIFDYIEKTASPSVQKLLLEAHYYLQETLPPFCTCGIKWKIPFYKVHRNICYLERVAQKIFEKKERLENFKSFSLKFSNKFV